MSANCAVLEGSGSLPFLPVLSDFAKLCKIPCHLRVLMIPVSLDGGIVLQQGKLVR